MYIRGSGKGTNAVNDGVNRIRDIPRNGIIGPPRHATPNRKYEARQVNARHAGRMSCKKTCLVIVRFHDRIKRRKVRRRGLSLLHGRHYATSGIKSEKKKRILRLQ